jgi:hypothetical protein
MFQVDRAAGPEGARGGLGEGFGDGVEGDEALGGDVVDGGEAAAVDGERSRRGFAR